MWHHTSKWLRALAAPLLLPALGLFAGGCSDLDEPIADAEKILDVPETESWSLAGLKQPVQVVRTESNVPHIYAHNREDLGFVLGFVTARDRYFMMDLNRRLGTGTISALLGDSALEFDQESRGSGMAFVTDQIVEGLSPELAAYVDAFAAGINAYIEQVKAARLPPPSELEMPLIVSILGGRHATELMEPFDRRDVAGMLSTIIYNSGYETGDVGRAANVAKLPTLFAGATNGYLRRRGALEDMWQRIEPIMPIASAPGWSESGTKSGSFRSATASKANGAMLERLVERLERQQLRLNRDRETGYGSNAWAVSADFSADGSALLATDGHLSLTVPSILYRLGLDTAVFGGGDQQQLGMTIPGLPVIPLGTNGRIAWSYTQMSCDITDWYLEQMELDAGGKPVRTLFKGEWKGLTAFDEQYEIADIEFFDSVGRTESWTRWMTFDGRWIADIEGRDAAPDEVLAAGETLVNLRGDYVVPSDVDGDGVVTAVSFDYAGFEAGATLPATDALGHAEDVYDFSESAEGVVAFSLNFAVADSSGNILYGAYQPIPCRDYLERDGDGGFAEGADPNVLLDGTKYGAFSVPIVDGRIDHHTGDPQACAIPYSQMPHAINPAQGYVVTANNDPGGLSFDGSLTNDLRYIGGPWDTGFRADKISRELERAIADGSADLDKMAEIQGNMDSAFGEMFAARLLESVAYAEGLGASPPGSGDRRIADMYQADKAAVDEAKTRIEAWAAHGFKTRSGVETFYAPAPSQQERDDAVATMIFNAWMSRVLRGVFDDEGLPGVFQRSGTQGRAGTLDRFLRGRGADNPLGIASHDPQTNESVFFDVLGTEQTESSHEVIVTALVGALAFLRSTPDEEADPATGGFATADMNQWLWGMRHYVKFESLLADFIGGDSEFSAITDAFNISTALLPLLDGGLPVGDPRRSLKWFPRPGDQYGVDAANPGTSGTKFSHGSGPVMRMVITLKGDEVRGVNIMPGGQSSLTDSPYFTDQARLWLANETQPMRFTVDQVVAWPNARRESYNPK